MPITFSFDLETASVKDPNDRTRIQVAFLRFGWEHIGGSCWRYPILGTDDHPSEDWFNHVIPALAYFRALVEHSGIKVTRFALDAHSEAGHRSLPGELIGQPILPSESVKMYPPNLDKPREDALTEARLKKFLADAASSLQ